MQREVEEERELFVDIYLCSYSIKSWMRIIHLYFRIIVIWSKREGTRDREGHREDFKCSLGFSLFKKFWSKFGKRLALLKLDERQGLYCYFAIEIFQRNNSQSWSCTSPKACYPPHLKSIYPLGQRYKV